MRKTILTVSMAIFAMAQTANAQTFDWAKQMGGSIFDVARKIAVDASGNVYTTGYFTGTADFDPGSGTFNLTSFGGADIFVSKLDASGNFIWAIQMGGSLEDEGYDIAIDASGNVYTAGYFRGTADFDPGAGAVNLTSFGLDDNFISKLDAAGNFVWAVQTGGADYDLINSIAVDASGNVYTTGYFYQTADFDPGVGTANLVSFGDNDIFISKLDAAGNFVWAKQLGGLSNDVGQSIVVDAAGNVFTTGDFTGAGDFDPGAGVNTLTSFGGKDIFISKLNATGNFVWAKQIGGTTNEAGFDIALDPSGYVYTVGYFTGSADFDPSASGVVSLTSFGLDDNYISKLDTAGNFVWAKQTGGTNYDLITSVALDGSGNIYTTGYFYGTADFDPGVGTANFTAYGSNDIFVSRLDASGNFVWAKQMGGGFADAGNGITTDASGNVYTTGRFNYTVDFDPDAGTFDLTSLGTDDIFVHKINAGSSGISITSLNTRIAAYPNPTSGAIRLVMADTYDQINISVLNISGQQVLSCSLNQTSQVDLIIPGEAGVYFAEITTGAEKEVVKIIKQ